MKNPILKGFRIPQMWYSRHSAHFALAHIVIGNGKKMTKKCFRAIALKHLHGFREISFNQIFSIAFTAASSAAFLAAPLAAFFTAFFVAGLLATFAAALAAEEAFL